MTSFTRFNLDGTRESGIYHPELAEASLCVLKRDLKLMKKHNIKHFLRKPYDDLHESEIVKLQPNAPSEIAGVIVTSLIAGDTNARMFLSSEEVQKELSDGEIFDLWTDRPSKGFRR